MRREWEVAFPRGRLRTCLLWIQKEEKMIKFQKSKKKKYSGRFGLFVIWDLQIGFTIKVIVFIVWLSLQPLTVSLNPLEDK